MSSAQKSRELEDVFAVCIADNHEFRSWLLSRTKFAKLWPLARLLDKEQAAQSTDSWWRNWSASSRTDGGLFLGYELSQTRLRFGVYVAVAMTADDLSRVEIQRQRACEQAMTAGAHVMNMMDFQTVLIAPQAIVLDDRTLGFDRRIPFETVAGFVPDFSLPQRIAA